MSWTKGRQEDGSETIFLTVAVRQDVHGRIVSAHFPETETDEATLQTWRGGGLEQVAFALLTEAVRREALLDVILKASVDPGITRCWASSSEEERAAILQGLVKGAQESMGFAIDRLIESAMRSALDMITSTRTGT